MTICIQTQEEINLDTGLYCCQTVCAVYIVKLSMLSWIVFEVGCTTVQYCKHT